MLSTFETWWHRFQTRVIPKQEDIWETHDGYFSIILTKLPCIQSGRIAFPKEIGTQMGRDLPFVCAEVSFDDGRETTSVVFATSHLESLAENSTRRLAQLQYCFDRLPSLANHVVFGGDTNIIEDVDCDVRIPAGWNDAWLEAGFDHTEGFTFDARENKLVDGPYLERLDRLFTCSDRLRVSEIDIVGKQRIQQAKPLPSSEEVAAMAGVSFKPLALHLDLISGDSEYQDVWISDHYGLFATLRL
mmetsp:Transcript_74802/g.175600  ORF Transcript_74802/g.175600 Transcript_74802/m.175600 type:complete len:245 (-) Transcript_74802:72-806(-)